ncbi:MAG: O-antigen ligase family protein [Cyclobacteriaceae bacterium]|nr:O-antigen ligase family protein [Cyclobacteriaceae bacterium]
MAFLILFCLVNYFFVNVSISSYAQGMFFSFLFAFNFILFYNLGLSKSDFFLLSDVIIFIITLIAILSYFERIFFSGEYQSYFLRGVITLVKDPAFAAALFNINIILSLSIYLVNKQRKYLYIVIFSIITISLLLFLKALIAAIIICLVFITIYYNSQVTKLFLYVLAVFFFLMLMITGKPLVEEIKYKAELYFGQGSERTPRNALYIAGFKMARDHFPFGSGQGTFGSYPVGKEYSKVYYDYNLDKVHGLGPEDAQGKTDSNFIFDTYWSSILGEMGFIGGFTYLFLWILPANKSRRFLKSHDLETRAIAFFVFMTIVSVFIESIASPIPGQLQFIVIYSGLGAIGYRILKTQPS